ncbi:MAG: glycosyltransferase family 87 protein [Stellaceae bacterium]
MNLKRALRDSKWLTRERVRAYAVIVLAVEVAALLILAARTYDLILPIDPPTSLDYMSFYAAGTLTDRGTPALAYNELVHENTEKQIYGDTRIPYFGFYYPPVFELVCAALAALPFTLSYLLFVLITGAAYFAVLRGTIRDPVLIAALLCFPASFLTVALGQNSFLTAALFGGALLILDRRPVLAGVMLGALCYKPHFLLLVPVALLAGRYWLTIVSAAVTTLVLAGLSLALFGVATWEAWFTNTLLAQSVFETGRVGFYHLVSLFGAVSLVGGGARLAMAAQAVALLAAVAAVAIVWYRRADMAIRAATLIAATLVALPVILFYDLLPATIAIAWLMRDARARGYFPWEKTILCAMWPVALLCRGIGEQTHVPIGWLLTFGLLGLALAHYRRGSFAENVAQKA